MLEKVRSAIRSGPKKPDTVKGKDPATESAQNQAEDNPKSAQESVRTEHNVGHQAFSAAAEPDVEEDNPVDLEPEVESVPYVEEGDDMREIHEAYQEADERAEEERADEIEEEEPIASASETSTPENPELPIQGEPEIEISDAEAREIADEVRSKANNVESEQEEIGRIIFHKGFKGRMDLVSSKDPLKSASFPKIHKLLDDILPAKTLSTYTRTAAFRERLVSLGKESRKLAFGPLRELVSVEDENRRVELAEEVYRKSLSVQKTRKRVAEVNAEKAPEKSLKRIVRKMHDPLSLPGGKEFEKLISDPDRLQKDLSKSERMTLRSGIATKNEHIDKCLSHLKELDEFLAMIDA